MRRVAVRSSGLRTGDDGLVRCVWCGGDALYQAYHDREWGFPVGDDLRLFEKICLEGFQAGLSWLTVLRKREAFRRAFRGFDPPTVANLSDGDIGRLLTDQRIVRNRQKILSVPHNAAWLVELAAEHGTAAAFFADWPEADYVGLLNLMKKRGSRLGGFTGMILLRSMGKDSFFLNDDIVAALVREGVVPKKGKGM